MKTIIPLLSLAIFLVGCGNNSMNQSNATNSMPGEPPASSGSTSSPSNDMINNNPPTGTTNVPVINNNADTNLPGITNQ